MKAHPLLGDLPLTTAPFSTACAGACVPVPPGAICRNGMGRGALWPAVSPAGGGRGSSSVSWRRCSRRLRRRAASMGPATCSIVPSSERPSLRLGHTKGPRDRSARTQPRWLQPQNPSAGRRPREAERLAAHAWAAPRGEILEAPEGPGCDEAPWGWAPEVAAAPAHWRSGLEPPGDSPVPAGPWHPPHDSPQTWRASPRPV
jgi:hypothetical protein